MAKAKFVDPRDVDLGDDEVAFCSVDAFKGNVTLNLRKQYEVDGQLKPAKNGININIDKGLVAIQALLDAYNESLGTNFFLCPNNDADEEHMHKVFDV